MKTVKNPIVTISADGKTGTVTFDIVDAEFDNILTSRNSHGHANAANMRHCRYIQSSNAAVFVSSAAGKAAVVNEFISAIAAAVEPKTTFAPVITKKTTASSVDVASETPVKYQWQISDDAYPKSKIQHTPAPAAVWTDIDGEIAKVIDESKIQAGKWIRCIATNATGSVITKPALNK